MQSRSKKIEFVTSLLGARMFRAKTVLVVGAGASTEVGLPMGHDLLKRLVKLTHITFEYHRQKTGDPEIVEALRIILNEGQEVEIINQYIKAGWQLSELQNRRYL
jgi:hypothetical protein